MSWPQNPQDPQQQPAQPQSPQPPQGGFGPPPVWGPDGTGHAQPTMIGQPAVPAPPPPPGGASVPPPPAPAPGPGGPGAYGGAPSSTAPMAPIPPSGPEPKPAKSRALLATVGGVVALAVIGGGVAYVLTSGKNDDGKKASSSAASQAPSAPAQQQGGQPAPDTSVAPQGASGGKALVAGWQTQVNGDHHFAYDVPPKGDQWKVFPTDTMISYTEDNKPVVTMRGTANFREGGCSSSPNPDAFGEAGKGQLATVGTTGGGKDGTLQENARNWAGNWGVMAYGGLKNKPKIEVGEAVPWKHNGIEGYTATAKVTIANRASECVPPTAIVKSIAQKLPDGTFHGWVIYADQGVPNALSAEQIEKIMGTVRPTKG
ncbi:hypothetical protein ACMATS_22110 [Streptoverticillium reticulum]|uniref:hypothetical protein n=2 Tax=Streptomyces TaxID=1883 RepID=UPI0039BF003B